MWSLGQKLRGVREAKPGLSLRKLAARTHIDKRSLSLYERDKQDPPFSRLKRLCEALQIRAGYLFDEIEGLRRLRPSQVAARESFRLLLHRRRLTPTAKKELARYAESRARAQAEVQALRRATRNVVSTLTSKFGISLRDASALLGLSRERVRQLTV